MKYFKTQEVADKLGVSYLTVYTWIKDNCLPAFKFRRELRISSRDLSKFMQDRRYSKVGKGNKVVVK